jgi:hypothetical protein
LVLGGDFNELLLADLWVGTPLKGDLLALDFVCDLVQYDEQPFGQREYFINKVGLPILLLFEK